MPDIIKEFERENPRVKQIHMNELKQSLIIPSPVHSYSLAVEYMINWFKSCMPDNYFKTVHVSGKHVLDDFRRFDEGIFVKRLKPALTIIPNINLEYNRNNVDLYNYGPNLLYRVDRQLGESFFKDFNNNLFLGTRVKQIEMPFTFRVRVNSKSEQMRVFEEVMLHCRVMSTENNYICADFILPKELMKSIAKDAHFKFDKNGEIESPVDFCIYLNKHSGVPFIYKRRNITGTYEYFVRVNGVHAHIDILDFPSVDDGEQVGQIYDNYMVELQVMFRLSVPHFYYYFGREDNGLQVKCVDHSDIGIYTIKANHLYDEDENGFQWIVDEEYMVEKEDLDAGEINIKGWIDETVKKDPVIKAVFDYCENLHISNRRFLNIKFVQAGYIDIDMDYDTFIVKLPKNMKKGKGMFIVYMNLSYINDVILDLQKAEKTRMG